MKTRPLGELSNFVVDTMPAMLASSPAMVRAHADELAVRCHANPSDFDHNTIAIARLDAKMLEAAVVHTRLPAPESVIDLVDRLSGDELPMLSYEEIVLANPRTDMRVFTTGEIGETEAAFYRNHRHVEEQLESAIHDVRRAIDTLQQKQPQERAAEMLVRTKHYLKEIPGMMATLKNMPEGHFEYFRRYLGSHPARGLKGPSGLFSAGIPILEVLFRGNELPHKSLVSFVENIKYLPRDGRAQLESALSDAHDGKTLISLWRQGGQTAALGQCIDVLGGFFNGFRKAHHGAVRQQLPDALNDKIAGTGGESNPGQFLRDRIQAHHYRRNA